MVTHFRIVGLDPAGPLKFSIANKILGGTHLKASDADAVHIVNTDKFVYGNPISSGTATFNVNGGFRIQPGCPLTIPFSLTKPGEYAHCT